MGRGPVAYANVLARETGQKNEPAKLIAPMLARFMATDRGFAKARKDSGLRAVLHDTNPSGASSN